MFDRINGRYQDGFGRFCSENYEHNTSQMDNLFMHLTNVAIQKNSENYTMNHGGKWNLATLKFYIESMFGQDTLNQVPPLCSALKILINSSS